MNNNVEWPCNGNDAQYFQGVPIRYMGDLPRTSPSNSRPHACVCMHGRCSQDIQSISWMIADVCLTCTPLPRGLGCLDSHMQHTCAEVLGRCYIPSSLVHPFKLSWIQEDLCKGLKLELSGIHLCPFGKCWMKTNLEAIAHP
eukprot:1952963-Amphidinium_carterae.1